MKKTIYTLLTFLSATALSFGQVVTPQVHSNGRVFYLPLNSTSQGADQNGNYGFEVFNSTYTEGLTGAANEAIVSGGSSSIIRTFTQSDLQAMNGTFTVGMWVRINGFQNLYSNLFEMGQNHFLRIAAPIGVNNVNFEYGFLDENGNYKLFGQTGSSAPVSIDASLFTGKWMHVALTSSVSGTDRYVELFINGILVQGFGFAAPSLPHFTQNEHFTIGSRFNTNNLTLAGSIQDFVWYNRVLTDDELRELACYANANITENDGALSVNTGMYTYQWLDCNNDNTPIQNATGNSYVFPGDGGYAVTVRRNIGCAVTSECFIVDTSSGGGGNLSIGDANQNNILVYPNPAKEQINIEGLEIGNEIEIVNILGVQVFRETAKSVSQKINVNTLANGVYFVRVTQINGEIFQHRIVVND
jgi:hypothetical protein